ncbi:right-handed parallel beta-helix repeat-containing protein [Alicyclobacillus fastidiosus]|uniref:Right-handed parallel beta-helix repeat-containing protein n=1 Tax=Alicyclobacillus fastidiosus TaxID=392011 RepID=A0ABY6ZEM9_9BACL|nr:right-handed parallel beta-helix repeat-containing protein [Alicyclobacillus fastidiosus]WAH40619.1 right-handed parallel beta-helix repeat-containing protein [Alicyclobacillus fastidiosus]GMA62062.1 hypothetical protein GCM10025859_25020 [Alicyclobacillus fastidiosus]
MVAMNSWIIDNDILQNVQSGIRTVENTTWGSAIVENRIQNNGADGITDGAGFNLIHNNDIRNNHNSGVHEHAGIGYAGIIKNVLAHNLKNGVNLNTNGSIVRNSVIQNNKRTGIRIQGNVNTVEQNKISNNRHYGILLTMQAECTRRRPHFT